MWISILFSAEWEAGSYFMDSKMTYSTCETTPAVWYLIKDLLILCFLRGLDILKRPPMAGERPWDCYRATSVINVPLDYILAYIYELDFRGEWDDMFLKGIHYQFLVSCQDWCCTTLQTWDFLTSFNPLTPKSDQHITSPHNIHTLSSKKVMRLLRLIR